MAASVLAIITLLVAPVHASTFLGAHPTVHMESMATEEVEQAFLTELSAKTGNRIHLLKSELSALFTAMPKNSRGKLDPNVVRYALHRHFAHKYGWHLRGLEPNRGSWNTSLSIGKDQAPSYIASLMEKRTQGEGLGLEELAIFAATLTDLVRQETTSDLEAVLAKLPLEKSDDMSVEGADELLKAYLMTYLKGGHAEKHTSDSLEELEWELSQHFIAWVDAKTWIDDLRPTTDFTQHSVRNPFRAGYTFDQVADASHEMGKRFGAFQNLECQTLKQQLMELAHESGRVLLPDFYSGAKHRDWPFIEGVPYLRNLGSLDETDPNNPSVIIPNYLSSPSNCISGSSFYSVCCIDECEGLLSQVELMVGQPIATADRLAEVVSRVGSETVEAPRQLGSLELARLGEIAEFNGGHVPLHGRLFAQWMHHAYPLECRFPHVAGTTNPLNQEEFSKRFGLDGDVTDAEIDFHSNSTLTTGIAEELVLPWHDTEELIAPHGVTSQRTGMGAADCIRALAFFVAVIAATLPVVRASKLSHVTDKLERHLV